MPDEQRPFFMDPTKHWCPMHLEPYRARWPEGAALAMVKLFQAFSAAPKVHEWYLPRFGLPPYPPEALHQAMDELAPLCCVVGDEVLGVIYHDTGVVPPWG
jgi:hypothetical protein